ncbi:MAG: hypothetical protein R3A52_03730 [Polyangiales bacterium]
MTRKTAADTAPVTSPIVESDPFVVVEQHIDAIDQATSGLQPLNAEKRSTTGRTVLTVVAPTRVLCGLLTAAPSDPAKVPRWKRFVGAFDLIGAHDGGDDPDRFEPERITARIDRVERATFLAEKLERAARRLRDDALRTSESLTQPVTLALDLARTLARGEFADELVPVTDALAALTYKARRAKKTAAQAQPEPDSGAE